MALPIPTGLKTPNWLLSTYAVVFASFWVYTLLGTTDLANWCIENIMTVLGLSVITLTYRRFQFNAISYTLIFIHLMLHIYGAMYTYSENPLGYWLKEMLGWNRNHYDRIVHFCFGLFLAYPMRDYFMRYFEWPVWVCWVLPCEITLSFSGMYELIEWAVAELFFPAQGVAYLGTQGDIWDAQKDMGLAFGGSVLCMALVAGLKSVFKKPI